MKSAVFAIASFVLSLFVPMHVEATAPSSTVFDPQMDAVIAQAFASQEFVNEVFCYSFNHTDYLVRILHNPEGNTYKVVRQHNLRNQYGPGSKKTKISISWNCRYGIITEQVVPQELIDHLSKLTQASNWNWYFNFKIHNGDYVEHKVLTAQTASYTEYLIYTLDSWFDYTEDLRLPE